MTWLIILAILAAAFAPVAYMMPSKRDKALAEARLIARREGLEVDVTQLPKLDAPAHERVSASGKAREASVDCVSYGLRLTERSPTPCRYRILHLEGTEFPVAQGQDWELDRGFPPATAPVPDAAYWAVLDDIRALLPRDALGLAVTDDFVLCYWRERFSVEAQAAGGSGRDAATVIADIRRLLNKVAEHHLAYWTPEVPPEVL